MMLKAALKVMEQKWSELKLATWLGNRSEKRLVSELQRKIKYESP